MKKFVAHNNIEIKNGKISYIDMKSRQKVEKEFKVSLSDIHEKLRKVEYVKEYDKCKDIKDTEIERTKMIPFAYVYYYHFAKNLQIPSPNEFVDEYFDMFCYKKKNGMFAFKKEHDISCKPNFEFKYLELKGRILRSYNTFNREIELLVKLSERLKGMNIEYNLFKDLFSGVDLTITHQGKKVGIAEYVSTKRSKEWKIEKNENRHNYDDKRMIDVIAVFGGKDKNVCSFGEVYCYDDDTVKKIERQIKDMITKETSPKKQEIKNKEKNKEVLTDNIFAKLFKENNINAEDFTK